MTCCHRCAVSKQFDARTARRDLRRFERRGPDASTRVLLAAVQSRPLPPDPTLLDIGGGIGAIQHVLLERGFASATQVDASEAYLAASAEEAQHLGHADRVTFQLAEFPAEATEVPPADAVTLDRVVCCDPDYARLLGAAAGRARHLVAFSYPRPSWLSRIFVAAINASRRLRGRAFRAYLHPPARMRTVLGEAGLRQAWAGGTWIWAVELFER
ncbi:MAG TPA: methyltransferase domain-containing protein [Gemmatimonadales bacterium]|nr:methyltransferase domain-containing protein [Gemmatimonadales bacterium]